MGNRLFSKNRVTKGNSMPTSPNLALRFWLLIFAAFIGLFFLFKPILMPFLDGLAIAYFLEPVVSSL